MRRSPGVTAWAKWAWKATAVIPGAGQASWKVLRRVGDATEYHASTHDLWLYVSDAEAYAHELQARTPSIYIVLRSGDTDSEMPLNVHHVTVSPYEAQDYCDSGEEIVEKVAMSEDLLAWVYRFVDQHYVEEAFVKRRRDKAHTDRKEDGIGDARISQVSDVYRSPSRAAREAAE